MINVEPKGGGEQTAHRCFLLWRKPPPDIPHRSGGGCIFIDGFTRTQMRGKWPHTIRGD